MTPFEIAIVIAVILAVVGGNAAFNLLGPWGQLARYRTQTIPPGKKFRLQSAFLERGSASVFHQCSLACCVSELGIGFTSNFWLPNFLRRDILIPWTDILVGNVTHDSCELTVGDIKLSLDGKRLVTAVSDFSDKMKNSNDCSNEAAGVRRT